MATSTLGAGDADEILILILLPLLIPVFGLG